MRPKVVAGGVVPVDDPAVSTVSLCQPSSAWTLTLTPSPRQVVDLAVGGGPGPAPRSPGQLLNRLPDGVLRQPRIEAL
ncbi:MAG: hypothetical protein R3A46_15395 [Thermomicrobiales bacterium]